MARSSPARANDGSFFMIGNLTGKVGLGQRLEPITAEDRAGALDIVDMHGENRTTAWTNHQRIAEENIHFRFEESGKDLDEIRGTFRQLDHHDFALAERDVVFVEE